MKLFPIVKSRHSLAIASAACLMAVLLLFGSAVSAGKFQSIDEAILRNIREVNYPFDLRGSDALTRLFLAFSAMGSAECLFDISLAAAAFCAWRNRYWEAGLVIAALPLAGAAMRGLKFLYARARPEIIEHLQHAHGLSYPSGHSMLSTTVYLVVFLQLGRNLKNRWLRGCLILFALLIIFTVGLSRVYLGVHYPTDVLAGWAFGLLFTVVYCNVAEAFRPAQSLNRARSSSISARGNPPRSS